jgi:hypothetical protein
MSDDTAAWAPHGLTELRSSTHPTKERKLTSAAVHTLSAILPPVYIISAISK